MGTGDAVVEAVERARTSCTAALSRPPPARAPRAPCPHGTRGARGRPRPPARTQRRACVCLCVRACVCVWVSVLQTAQAAQSPSPTGSCVCLGLSLSRCFVRLPPSPAPLGTGSQRPHSTPRYVRSTPKTTPQPHTHARALLRPQVMEERAQPRTNNNIQLPPAHARVAAAAAGHGRHSTPNTPPPHARTCGCCGRRS